VCDLETSRMGAPYIYDISRLRVKDLHSATYIYVVRRLRVNTSEILSQQRTEATQISWKTKVQTEGHNLLRAGD